MSKKKRSLVERLTSGNKDSYKQIDNEPIIIYITWIYVVTINIEISKLDICISQNATCIFRCLMNHDLKSFILYFYCYIITFYGRKKKNSRLKEKYRRSWFPMHMALCRSIRKEINFIFCKLLLSLLCL